MVNFRKEKLEHTLKKIRTRLRFSQRSPKTEAPDFLVCLKFFRKFTKAVSFLLDTFLLMAAKEKYQMLLRRKQLKNQGKVNKRI
jgi:hypothetical protein